MPSRPVVVLVVLFWAAAVGAALYRDVWPLVAASGPPPIVVDLGDETSQHIPIHWQLYRGDAKVGRLTTRVRYVDADDTFEFSHKYVDVKLDVGGVRVGFPDVTAVTRVGRDGGLREQSMDGRMEVQLERRNKAGEAVYETLATATAKVAGRVENGVFVGRCVIVTPVREFDVDADLEPVPAPGGSALSPMQPVNRIGGLRPGRRWVVHQVDPLGEAVAAVFGKQFGGLGLPDQKREPFIAEVGGRPEEGPGGRPCWVIRYRHGGEERAETWVRVDDGKVVRQEATLHGERLRLEREEER